jgi:BirA family biotin operon repressor/biotin-[acetyl-CoA-carboxylase] ligase
MGESAFSDLERPPLNEKALNSRLVRPGSLWREIRVVAETGSTNADLAAAARGGGSEGTVLVAEAQTSGRGRLGRSWTAPPRSGLMFSMLLRPRDGAGLGEVAADRQGWLPLLTGLAVAAAVRKITLRAGTGRFDELTGGARGGFVETRLKWPNDVIVGERKLAGILAERADDAVVIGVGLNVSLRQDELPVPTATSLVLEGASWTDREPLLRAVLRQFEEWYVAWCAVGGDPDADPPGGYPAPAGVPVADTLDGGLRGAYKTLCATLGREVRVELPGGTAAAGAAADIDSAGRLVVDGQAYSAGDVVHVR